MNLNLTLIGQIGTFLVFWWFTYTYVWPMFDRVAQERRKKIADGLSMADKAKQTVFSAEQESQALLDEAKEKARTIVENAEKQAEKTVAQAREEAQSTGRRELEQARGEIEQERQKVREQLRAQLAALVIQGAEQVIGREVNADDHARLIQELSEKL